MLISQVVYNCCLLRDTRDNGEAHLRVLLFQVRHIRRGQDHLPSPRSIIRLEIYSPPLLSDRPSQVLTCLWVLQSMLDVGLQLLSINLVHEVHFLEILCSRLQRLLVTDDVSVVGRRICGVHVEVDFRSPLVSLGKSELLV